MERCVAPEFLDTLSPSDARAMGSRRDLQRLNVCMGNARVVAGWLAQILSAKRNLIVSDLGGGDGTFAVRVARACPRHLRVTLHLVDRHPTIANESRTELKALGWEALVMESDVFDYLESAPREGAIVCNLFLHHFEGAGLRRLLELAARRCRFFIACEPRRALLPLVVSRSLFVIGCNAVTRHDAPVSVRAGFRGSELSRDWPAEGWRVDERRAGLFTHLFTASAVQ